MSAVDAASTTASDDGGSTICPWPLRQGSSTSVTPSQASTARAVFVGAPARPPPLSRRGTWWPRSASASLVIGGLAAGAGGGDDGLRSGGSPPLPRRPPPTGSYVCSVRIRPQQQQAPDVVLGLTVVYLQCALVVVFVACVRYDVSVRQVGREVGSSMTMFQDVHVMIFVGFGFLMMFLRKYGYSAVGFTLLLGAVMVQWAMLCQGFFNLNNGKILVSMVSLLNADVATAAVLISMGAVLGKTTPLQLVVMGVVEMVIFAANEYLSSHVLQAVDLGGSMVVHVFGAYFGLAVSRAMGRPADTTREGSSYASDLFAMIGTVFLWLFWPSFNGALAADQARHRAVVNTYLALASGCVVAFAVSSLVRRGKFNMVHVQNATLAGGVAMGTAADLMVQPVGALVIGGLAGALSVVGYAYLQPVVLDRLQVHDTCGVHNLHGMPGVFAGLVGAVMAAIASTETYGGALYLHFPAMSPRAGSQQLQQAQEDWSNFAMEAGEGRTSLQQAGFQLASLAATLVVSVVTGTLTGHVIRQERLFRQPGKDGLFEDGPHWDVADEETGDGGEGASTADPATTTVAAVVTARKASTSSTEAANNIPTLSAEAERDDAGKKW